MRVQQPILDGLAGLLFQSGKPGLVDQVGFRRLALDALVQVQVDQLRVEADFQCREQLLAFFAVQVAVGQFLVQRTATLQVAFAVVLELLVEALEVALFGGRRLFFEQWGVDPEQVLSDLVEVAFGFCR